MIKTIMSWLFGSSIDPNEYYDTTNLKGFSKSVATKKSTARTGKSSPLTQTSKPKPSTIDSSSVSKTKANYSVANRLAMMNIAIGQVPGELSYINVKKGTSMLDILIIAEVHHLYTSGAFILKLNGAEVDLDSVVQDGSNIFLVKKYGAFSRSKPIKKYNMSTLECWYCGHKWGSKTVVPLSRYSGPCPSSCPACDTQCCPNCGGQMGKAVDDGGDMDEYTNGGCHNCDYTCCGGCI